MSPWLLWLITVIYIYVCLEQACKGHWYHSMMYCGWAFANVGVILALPKS